MKRWCASRNALFLKNFKICNTNEYLPATFKIRSSSSMIVLNTYEICDDKNIDMCNHVLECNYMAKQIIHSRG